MSDKAIKLSVVAAVYNAESTFGDTLRCVFDSDIPVPFEVVVVDDASTDGTPALCESFDLKLIRLETNVGPSTARNLAVQESKGEIIMFIDSDVQFGPDLIRRMLERMDEDPDAAGVGSLSAPEALNPCFYSNYFAMQEWEYIATAIDHAPRDHGLGVCTRCGTLRKAIFDEVGGFDERYTQPSIEDYDLSMRILPRYRFIWDVSLENQHFFPESLGQIFRRYHRNTREMVGLMQEHQMEDAGLFQNDSRARIFFGMSGLALMLTLMYLPALGISVAFLFAGIWVKRDLFSLFWRRKGMMFCFGGIAVYILTSLPIATGLAAGTWRQKRAA